MPTMTGSRDRENWFNFAVLALKTESTYVRIGKMIQKSEAIELNDRLCLRL